MSLNQIISIRNTGRFQNCSASGDVSLKRFISAADFRSTGRWNRITGAENGSMTRSTRLSAILEYGAPMIGFGIWQLVLIVVGMLVIVALCTAVVRIVWRIGR